MKEKRNGKELIAICLLVLSLVLITVGTTFAFFQYSKQGQTENTLHTGNLTFVYDETRVEKNGVSLTNAFPMSDTNGKALISEKDGVFDFDIRATTQGADINYEIYLTKEDSSTLPEYAVKTYLTRVTSTEEVESEEAVKDTYNSEEVNLYSKLGMSKVPVLDGKEGRTLYQGTVADGKEDYTETYRFRMWIDEEADKVVNGSWKYNGMTFSVKVNVYAQNDNITSPTEPAIYKDGSGANSPDLVEGLIPVYYRDGEWRKADLYKDWYDYDIQEWANAVTVKETGTQDRSYYQEATPGTVIDMDDINTMWVWIPRYEYNYVSINDAKGDKVETCTSPGIAPFNCYENPGEIKINFVNEKSTNVSNENYKMHPAFTFGEDELTGIWYGKFETSTKEACIAADKSVGTGCDIETYTPEIKPSVTSWRGIRVSTAFEVSRRMQTTNYNIYGFSSSQTNYDTHMSKNSEWASVAYLSQSKYGKYGNDAYGIDDKEVYNNNCSKKITGIAGDSAKAEESADTCDINTYETKQGQKASTTGNITGVYDMSGGAYEYVMGILADENGQPRSGKNSEVNSGFNGLLDDGNSVSEGREIPDSKYYNLYNPTDTTNSTTKMATACDGGICYGHALSETAGWYKALVMFVYTFAPCHDIGGTYSSGQYVGIFNSGHAACEANGSTFRLTLAPIKK